MRVSILLSLVIVASLSACNKEKFTYQFLAYKDDNLKMWQDTLPIEAKSLIENSFMQMKDTDGRLLAKGDLVDGFKVREWEYFPSPEEDLKIEWAIFDSMGIKLNYPKNWRAQKSRECLFQAVFPIDSGEVQSSKYFIIVDQHKDSIGLTLSEYNDQYIKYFYEHEVIKGKAHYVADTYSGQRFYFSRYILERDGEEVIMLSFLGEVGDKIYDVAYGSLNTENEYKHIVFFEMLRSMILKETRFFSPFDPVKEFRVYELTTPSTGEKTS